MNRVKLLTAAILALATIPAVLAIPTAGIIPIIGPILAQIGLVVASGALFVMSKVSKHRKLFIILACVLFVVALVLIGLDVL